VADVIRMNDDKQGRYKHGRLLYITH
jgi:hypothetical protein